MKVSPPPLRDQPGSDLFKHWFGEVGNALDGEWGYEDRTDTLSISNASTSPTSAILVFSGYMVHFSLYFSGGVDFSSSSLQIPYSAQSTRNYRFQAGVLQVYSDATLLGVATASEDTITLPDVSDNPVLVTGTLILKRT